MSLFADPAAPEATSGADGLAPLRFPPQLLLTLEQFALVCSGNREAELELAADGSQVVPASAGFCCPSSGPWRCGQPTVSPNGSTLSSCWKPAPPSRVSSFRWRRSGPPEPAQRATEAEQAPLMTNSFCPTTPSLPVSLLAF